MKDEPRNLSGAIIFWLYIAAALVFTYLIIDTLLALPKSSSSSKRRDVRLFAVLAAFSFTVLSCTMLNVLIQSFLTWTSAHQDLKPRNVLDWFPTTWHWSVTSRLFQDFGNAIAEEPGWSQVALWNTLGICIHMGVDGRRRKIPRLWAFFALSQILPISFAQNLFYIAVLKTSPRKKSLRVPAKVAAGLWTGYGCCLWIASRCVGTEWLIPMILITRGLLLLPTVMPLAETESQADWGSAYLLLLLGIPAAGVSLVFAQFSLGQPSVAEILRRLWSHPAVTALGVDLIVSAVSSTIWYAIN